MARKGENIRKRKDGRWEARYIKGRNSDGSIQYGYVYARKYSDVKLKRNLAMQNIDKRKTVRRGKYAILTFNDLLDEWQTETRRNVKDSSYLFMRLLRTIICGHILGKLPIVQLTNELVQDL